MAVLADEAGKEVERQVVKATGDGKPLSFRFQFRPERKGRELLSRHMRFPPRTRRKDEQAGDDTATSRADARQ